MHVNGARAFGVVVAMIASGSAWAITWDWEDDFASRHWRSQTLAWAQNTHPDHPTPSWIQAHFEPPPHEQWCHAGPAPTPADCAELYDRVDLWLQDFLETDDVPLGALNTFPKECFSICNP